MTLQRTVITIAVVCVACSASPSINVGNEPDGSVAGSGGASGFGGVGGFGGGDDTLSALITEPPSAMAIDVITISCAGECKQVLAIASGGNDPYTFTWSDGVTTAAREICADEDTTLRVTVNDTAIVDGEFPYAGQSAIASVTANVLVCSDDGGAPPERLCIGNPSFEGVPQQNFAGMFDAPSWQACGATPDIYDEALAGSVPADGDTYLFLGGSPLVGIETVGQELCTPLPPGEVHHLTFELQPVTDGTEAALQVYGGSTSVCGEDELLAETPVIATKDVWTRVCVTIRASAERRFIKLKPASVDQAGFLVDHILEVESCP